MAEFNQLRTPKEFVDYHSQNLKDEFNNRDIQVNKLGFIGFFLNVLGNTTFDVKSYYDKLFQESFLALSREDHNQIMHGIIYGYETNLASASKAVGSLYFDFSSLPSVQSNVYRREVIFYNIAFNVNEYKFTTKTQYKFVEEGNNYYCILTNVNTGETRYISSTTSTIEAPFYEVYQFVESEEKITIQNYDFRTFYPYNIEVDEGYLNELTVKVKKPRETYQSENDWDNFEIKNYKYSEDAFTDSVFLKQKATDRFLLEFGSGVHGSYVPNTQAKIIKKVTKGKDGNIKTPLLLKLDKTTNCRVLNYKIDLNSGENIVDSRAATDATKKICYISFQYSEGGDNPLTGQSLNSNIINFVQTRDNFLSKQDFSNITENYFDDFKFVFKKCELLLNAFYLYKALRDKYKVPVKTLTYTKKAIDTTLVPTFSSGESFFESSGLLDPDDYDYYIVATDGFNLTQESGIVTVSVETGENAARISWNPVSEATSYIVYGRPDENGDYRRWKTINEYFEDLGQEGDIYRDYESIDADIREDRMIFNPIFDIDDEAYISPFVYKYNENMNWYAPYLFYNNFLVYMNEVYSQVDNLPIEQMSLPVFYFYVHYDYGDAYTYFDVKSSEDISDYILSLTINGLDIYSASLELVDNNTWRYSYNDSSYGIIWEKCSLEVEIKDSSGSIHANGVTGYFSQIISIVNNLKIMNYTDELDNNYILNIPLMKKLKYESDPVYYLDQISSFLQSTNFKENRHPTDEILLSFLNTVNIPSDKLEYLIKQDYLDTSQFLNNNIKLPLKLQVQIYVYKQTVLDLNIDLTSEKDEIYDEVAQLLQNNYTGTEIVIYNSQIVDFVHNSRSYIKQVIVTIKDNDDVVIDNGIESYPDDDIITNINNDTTLTSNERKLLYLEYCPSYFYWDLDNIDIKFIFN